MANNENYVSMSRAALILDCSVVTLKRWYIWYESPRYEVPGDLELPPYFYRDKRGTKFFKVSDIQKLKDFKDKIATSHYGCMAQYNADTAWGTRGQRFKRSKLREPRKKGEYLPQSARTPTDKSEEFDKMEEQKWQAEQEKELQKLKESLI